MFVDVTRQLAASSNDWTSRGTRASLVFMDAEDRQLLTHLFAKATALLEDAIEPAVTGQSQRNTAKTFARNAAQLRDAARNLAAIADAAETVVRQAAESSKSRKNVR